MSDNFRAMENPYLSDRQEYSDRYASVVKKAAHWRRISILMIMLCLVLGITMIWFASQNKITPYIVQVDKHGYAIPIRPAKDVEEWMPADEGAIVETLGRIFVAMKNKQDSIVQVKVVNRYPKKEGESWHIYWTKKEEKNQGKVIRTDWCTTVFVDLPPGCQLENFLENPFRISITEINTSPDVNIDNQ